MSSDITGSRMHAAEEATRVAPAPPRVRTIFGYPAGWLLLISYEVIWGVIEIGMGLLAWFSLALVARELAKDPSDALANWILDKVDPDPKDMHTLGIFLMFLGISKLLVAAGVWWRSWRIRNLLLGFFTLVTLVSAGDLVVEYSTLKAMGVSVDVVIIWYLWKRLPFHLEAP
jgi:hypothetical protein